MGENSGKVSHIARHRFKYLQFQKKKEITAIIIDIALYLI